MTTRNKRPAGEAGRNDGLGVPDDQGLHAVVKGFWDAKCEVERLRKEAGEADGTCEALREAEARYRRLSRVEVPAFLKRIGSRGFTTTGGLAVSVDASIHVAFYRTDKTKALQWLVENGHEVVADLLQHEHETPNQAHRAETSVLKSFVREQMQAGIELPLDLLGVSVTSIASVKRKQPEPLRIQVPRRGI